MAIAQLTGHNHERMKANVTEGMLIPCTVPFPHSSGACLHLASPSALIAVQKHLCMLAALAEDWQSIGRASILVY